MIGDNEISTVAKKFDVGWENDKEHTDYSYSGGRNIYLGRYKDPELRLVSFFHELGHVLIPQDFREKWDFNKLILEIECWSIGLEIARQEGILFSDSALKWGYGQALTYAGWEERELIPEAWEKRRIKLWISLNRLDL
jgi:hypothetical protein